MAKTVSVINSGGGKYTITDSDGQTRVVDQATAIKEAAKAGISVTSAQQNQNGYNTPFGSNYPDTTEKTVLMPDPKTGKLVSTSVTSAIAQAYGANRLGEIRSKLIKYGQLTKAEARDPNNLLNKWAQIVTGAANDPDSANRDPFKYAAALQKQGFISTFGATATGPTTYVQTAIPSATAISKTLDSIAADLLGRQLTQDEKNKYYSMLQAEEKKPGSATTTTVTPVGTGKQVGTTTGGLDEEQFLIQKIAGTDEAKAQKVLNAYTAVSNLFGGLK